ncbi:MAG: hypothetical protein ICV54_11385 [Nostoc sp. C3-bin3]|nr:hypothetical protein [Nostoc sp. C3-bin3]
MEKKVQCPMPHAPCPMPHALCPKRRGNNLVQTPGDGVSRRFKILL